MHFPQYSSVCSRFGLNNISCVKNLSYLPFSDFCRSNSLIMNGKRNSNRLVDIWKMSVSSSLSPSLIFHLPSLSFIRLPRYGNIVVLLRQHCCPATATLLSCYGNTVVLLRQHCSTIFIVAIVSRFNEVWMMIELKNVEYNLHFLLNWLIVLILCLNLGNRY